MIEGFCCIWLYFVMYVLNINKIMIYILLSLFGFCDWNLVIGIENVV